MKSATPSEETLKAAKAKDKAALGNYLNAKCSLLLQEQICALIIGEVIDDVYEDIQNIDDGSVHDVCQVLFPEESSAFLLVNGDLNTECKTFNRDVLKRAQTISKDELLKDLVRICNAVDPDEEFCAPLVQKNIDGIYQDVQNLTPVEVEIPCDILFSD